MPDVLTSSALDYYTRPGIMTDPQEHAALFDDLPRGIATLCRVVQGLLIHPFEGHLYGETLSHLRKQDLLIRPVTQVEASHTGRFLRTVSIPM